MCFNNRNSCSGNNIMQKENQNQLKISSCAFIRFPRNAHVKNDVIHEIKLFFDTYFYSNNFIYNMYPK